MATSGLPTGVQTTSPLVLHSEYLLLDAMNGVVVERRIIIYCKRSYKNKCRLFNYQPRESPSRTRREPAHAPRRRATIALGTTAGRLPLMSWGEPDSAYARLSA